MARRGAKPAGGTAHILLTALDAVAHRVKGLNAGADDYLVKSFAFSELLARVRNVLRRAPAHPMEILRIDDLEMDLLRHKANRGGMPLDLAPQEYRLLEYLQRHPGEVLTRTHLAEQVTEIAEMAYWTLLVWPIDRGWVRR